MSRPEDCTGPCTAALMPGESCEECGAVCPCDGGEMCSLTRIGVGCPDHDEPPAMSEQGATPEPGFCDQCFPVQRVSVHNSHLLISLCPLHAAAPALRDALRVAWEAIEDVRNGQRIDLNDASEMARAALAAVKGNA